jgi:hypothetical protein
MAKNSGDPDDILLGTLSPEYWKDITGRFATKKIC